VQRVKCELSDAFDRKIEQPEFLWLASWAAHVDLTLTINDNAGISPTGTFTQFYKNAVNFESVPTQYPVTAANAAARSVSQQFLTVSAGVSFSGQAIRTETVSFTIALDELKMWRQHQDQIEADPNFPPEQRACNFGPASGVTGNLGLEEWVDSAFYPVEVGQLEAGIHSAAAGKTASVSAPKQGAPGPKPAATLTVEDAKKNIQHWQSILTKLTAETKADSDAITSGKADVLKAQKSINTKIEDAKSQYRYVLASYLKERYARVHYLIDRYSDDLKTCVAAQNDITDAQAKAAALKEALAKANDKLPADQASGFEMESYDALEDLMERKIDIGIVPGTPPNVKKSQYALLMAKCAKIIEAATELPNTLPNQVDPPIDSLLHSVTFVVNYGASVTPSWTLLQWKGPGQIPNLLSASGLRTHLLVISIAPRTGAPAIGPDAFRLIELQAIRSINQQQ